MKYTPRFTEFSKSDYERLDSSQKQHVIKSLLKLEEGGMDAGQPLNGKMKEDY